MSAARSHFPKDFEQLLLQQKQLLRRGKVDPKLLARLIAQMNGLDTHLALSSEALWPDKYSWFSGKPHWLYAIYQRPKSLAHWLLYDSRRLPRSPWLARMLGERRGQFVQSVDHELGMLAKHPGLALVFIRHPNGYLREAGLKAIGQAPVSPFVLATVMYRLNDWVAPVRTAAANTVRRLFAAMPADTAAAVAPALASYSQHWGRSAAHRELFAEMLEIPGVISAIVALLASSQVKGSSALLNTLMARENIDAWLPVLAREARAPAVRAAASRVLIHGVARWQTGREIEIIDRYTGKRAFRNTYAQRPLMQHMPREDAIRNAADDRAASVRKLAVDAIINGNASAEIADNVIARLKSDPSPTVRGRIEFVIRNRAAPA